MLPYPVLALPRKGLKDIFLFQMSLQATQYSDAGNILTRCDIRCNDVDWIHMAYERVQITGFCGSNMNITFLKRLEIYKFTE
jgi:hypothetical protein